MTTERNSRFDRRGAGAEISFILIITVHAHMEWCSTKITEGGVLYSTICGRRSCSSDVGNVCKAMA